MLKTVSYSEVEIHVKKGSERLKWQCSVMLRSPLTACSILSLICVPETLSLACPLLFRPHSLYFLSEHVSFHHILSRSLLGQDFGYRRMTGDTEPAQVAVALGHYDKHSNYKGCSITCYDRMDYCSIPLHWPPPPTGMEFISHPHWLWTWPHVLLWPVEPGQMWDKQMYCCGWNVFPNFTC